MLRPHHGRVGRETSDDLDPRGPRGSRVPWLAVVLLLIGAAACGTTSEAAPTAPTAGFAALVDGGAGSTPPATEGSAGTVGTPIPSLASIPFSPTTVLPDPPDRAVPAMRCPAVHVPGGSSASPRRTGFSQGATPAEDQPPPSLVEPRPTDPPTTPSSPAPAESTTTTRPLTPDEAVARFVEDPRVAGNEVSVSVWIDGRGELTHNPDLALRPASTQKVQTAIGALTLLDPRERFHTDLVALGPVEAGVLHGDLALVGGGDPTLAPAGANSLDALASQLSGLGVTKVTGRIVIDESRFDAERTAPGWPAKWWEDVGSLSALSVDRNWYRLDAPFLADPQPFNGSLFKFALAVHGVAVEGDVATGSAPAGVHLARVESAPVADIVEEMLARSDNYYAEILVKQIARRRTGQRGTTAAGLDAIRSLLRQMCISVNGVDADGSGLSYDNRHSARDLRTILQQSQAHAVGTELFERLPAADGKAFGARYKDPAVLGRMRAKGGSLNVTRSLTGITATASGHSVVFAVIAHGDQLTKAPDAIEELVTSLARSP